MHYPGHLIRQAGKERGELHAELRREIYGCEFHGFEALGNVEAAARGFISDGGG
jgi:hypothetical protein